MMILFIISLELSLALAIPQCNQDDYRFEYTECDGIGNRWRVAVPKTSPSTCNGGFLPELPNKAVNCTFACDVGTFLEIKTQKCERCPNGTYSTGGGLRHDDFTTLPDGFAVTNDAVQFFSEGGDGDSAGGGGIERKTLNCSSGGWRTGEDGLVYVPSPCISVLSYTVRLVRPGELKYVYLFPDATDVWFTFQVQNERCVASDSFFHRSSMFPPVTPEGKWRVQSVKLKKGQSVVTWKAMGLYGGGQPILIRQIDVSGLPFSGQCTPCPKGTYSSGFASSCIPCPTGTYAPSKRSSSCLACDQDHYSGPRAALCETRQPCQTRDYYADPGVCDSNGNTKVTYKWIQPKICSEKGGVQLPADQTNAPCPPCEPGTKLVNGTCQFCPQEYYSDGRSLCNKCPANTAPNYGYYFTMWNRMPPRLKAECQPTDEQNGMVCNGVDGWTPMGGRISTGRVERQHLYLSLILDIPSGFRDVFAQDTGTSRDNKAPIAHLTFVFETSCTGGCGFYFVEQTPGEEDAMIVAQWNGTSKNLTFTYPVSSRDPVKYGWIFIPRDDMSNEASIYSIRVDNVVGGGATECRPCPIMTGAASNGACVSCPSGHYMTADTRQCVQCPNDTYLNVTKRVGPDACVNCGLNLRSMGGVECGVEDCRFNISQRVYDLAPLKGLHQTHGLPIFGREGSRYVHTYNVSVCGADKASCAGMIKDAGQTGAASASGQICRTTAFPQEKDTLYANPLVLADELVAIIDDPSTIVEGVNVSAYAVGEWKWRQLYFVYRLRSSDAPGTLASKNCPKGRGAVLVFRCDPAGSVSSMSNIKEKSSVLTLPSACPDGTCDGCFYTLLLTSPHACPRCGPSDYKRIVGECLNGRQAIHYIPNTKECVPTADDEQQHKIEHVACSLVTFQVRVIIVGSVVLCILLIILIIYVWKKNRRLEYKYMKLVESSGYGKEGELPAVESCGLQDGEDEEQPQERVVFAKGAWFRRKPGHKKGKGFAGEDGEDSTALAAHDDYEDA